MLHLMTVLYYIEYYIATARFLFRVFLSVLTIFVDHNVRNLRFISEYNVILVS
jgi:hypothetical protein